MYNIVRSHSAGGFVSMHGGRQAGTYSRARPELPWSALTPFGPLGGFDDLSWLRGQEDAGREASSPPGLDERPWLEDLFRDRSAAVSARIGELGGARIWLSHHPLDTFFVASVAAFLRHGGHSRVDAWTHDALQIGAPEARWPLGQGVGPCKGGLRPIGIDLCRYAELWAILCARSAAEVVDGLCRVAGWGPEFALFVRAWRGLYPSARTGFSDEEARVIRHLLRHDGDLVRALQAHRREAEVAGFRTGFMACVRLLNRGPSAVLLAPDVVPRSEGCQVVWVGGVEALLEGASPRLRAPSPRTVGALTSEADWFTVREGLEGVGG